MRWRRCDYPSDKLQVLLLLEADDDVTIAAAQAAPANEVIPSCSCRPAEPRTKPKACNYGLHCADRRDGHHLRRRGPARSAAAAPGGRGVRRLPDDSRLPPGEARLTTTATRIC